MKNKYTYMKALVTKLKKLITIILITLGLLTLGFQCKKDCDSDDIISIDRPEYDYEFIVNMNISPLQKTYNVGDTISLSFEISDNTLYDRKSQTDIELGHVEGNSIRFRVFFGFPYSSDPYPDIMLITNHPDITNNEYITGLNNIPNTSGVYEFIYMGSPLPNQISPLISVDIPCELFADNFQLELKYIPLSSGISSMFQFLEAPLPDDLVKFDTTGTCDDNSSNFQTGAISYKFDISDNNPELLQEFDIPCNTSEILEQGTEEKDFFWIKVE